MAETTYARLVRVCDERHDSWTTDRMANSLLGLVTDGLHKTQKPFNRAATNAPYKGQPVAALGSHGHDDLMLFGAYEGNAWKRNPDGADTMYPTVIDVRWEAAVFHVDPAEIRQILGGGNFPRSMKFITKAEYEALRAQATPLVTP